MIERIVIIDKVDPVQFYGVNNANMHLLKNLFPKLRISARGSGCAGRRRRERDRRIRGTYQGSSATMPKQYNALPEDVIIDIVKGEAPRERKTDGAIIYGVNGKPISARTPNQAKAYRDFRHTRPHFRPGGRPVPAKPISP